MRRLINADELEKEGWSLHRTVRVDRNTSEYQVKQIAKIPTIEPERTGKWMPVSERLPEDDVQVLCTDSEGFVYIAWHCDYDIIKKRSVGVMFITAHCQKMTLSHGCHYRNHTRRETDD